MPKKDLKQVDDIAQQYNMIDSQREDFGDYIEDLKREGFRGSKNKKGDFTYKELRQLAQEFLEEYR